MDILLFRKPKTTLKAGFNYTDREDICFPVEVVEIQLLGVAVLEKNGEPVLCEITERGVSISSANSALTGFEPFFDKWSFRIKSALRLEEQLAIEFLLSKGAERVRFQD